MEDFKNGLYIVSTPIGNLEDITDRAKWVLKNADFIICENPIHSLKLLNKLGIKKKLYSLHDYNEDILIKKIDKFQENSKIALISDAGSPLISDPGYKLVLDFINKKFFITTIPGANSVISALQLSGLPVNNFKFFGFLPKNKKSIETVIKEIMEASDTSVLFVSGLRLLGLLEEFLKNKFKKNLAVCKEITKKNERVFRGDIFRVMKDISSDQKNIKGEFVVIVEGVGKKTKKTVSPIIEKNILKLLSKFSLTEVVEIVHTLSNISKKEIYTKALLLKK